MHPRQGLTSKIHAVVDTNGLPARLALTAGEVARIIEEFEGGPHQGRQFNADRPHHYHQ